jgi:Zn-finger nucleic acid-binding protein
MAVHAGGLSLDGCARCGGVWLLRSAAGAARHLTPEALAAVDAELGWFASAARPAPGVGTPRACPVCRTPMEQRPDALHSSLRIDACRACSGVWLDPGELSKYGITRADRAAATRNPAAPLTTEDGLIGFAWCAEILGALLDITLDS